MSHMQFERLFVKNTLRHLGGSSGAPLAIRPTSFVASTDHFKEQVESAFTDTFMRDPLRRLGALRRSSIAPLALRPASRLSSMDSFEHWGKSTFTDTHLRFAVAGLATSGSMYLWTQLQGKQLDKEWLQRQDL